MERQRLIGMVLIFALGVGFGAVLGGWRAVSVEEPQPPAHTILVPSTPANLSDPTYLGVRAGDVLVSVNGVKDASMFHVLDAGIKRGNVCVTFERDAKLQEVCLSKPRPENTGMAASDSNLPSGVGLRPERVPRAALGKLAEEGEPEVPFIDPDTGVFRRSLRSPRSARHLREPELDGEADAPDTQSE